MEHTKFKRHMALYLSLLALLFTRIALGCDQPSTIREASSEEIRSFFNATEMKVLTFLGYSAAEYENKAAMLQQANRILDEFDPRSTIVNIGATPEGIGAVYEMAKRKGFLTTGIVSSQAKENNVKLSPLRRRCLLRRRCDLGRVHAGHRTTISHLDSHGRKQ